MKAKPWIALGAAALAMQAADGRAAQAGAYPAKPLRLIVPLTAGQLTDGPWCPDATSTARPMAMPLDTGSPNS